MHITLHLALAAIIGFGLSEARQQEHDIGKTVFKIIIVGTYQFQLILINLNFNVLWIVILISMINDPNDLMFYDCPNHNIVKQMTIVN